MMKRAMSPRGFRSHLYRSLNKRKAIDWPGGVVSFTFDDFPKSALHHGGTILEKYEARGTYYTAAGLAGSEDEVGPMFDISDVQAAFARGHEIACHTRTHLNCARANASTMRAEIRDNTIALSALTGGIAPTNFAFPFGAVSPLAKRVMRPMFVTCRGISGGINHAQSDLAELCANKIYDSEFDEKKIRSVIDENEAMNGWLIFYTHGVDETPKPYGCTPAQFELVVNWAAQCSKIAPVGEVAHALGLR